MLLVTGIPHFLCRPDTSGWLVGRADAEVIPPPFRLPSELVACYMAAAAAEEEEEFYFLPAAKLQGQ